MTKQVEQIARALEPQLWGRWDDRANRHPLSEKLLSPLIGDSLAKASRVFAVICETAA